MPADGTEKHRLLKKHCRLRLFVCQISFSCIFAASTSLTLIPDLTAIAAAVPAASPSAKQIGMARKFECAICVPDMFLPQSRRPSVFTGTRHL